MKKILNILVVCALFIALLLTGTFAEEPGDAVTANPPPAADSGTEPSAQPEEETENGDEAVPEQSEQPNPDTDVLTPENQPPADDLSANEETGKSQADNAAPGFTLYVYIENRRGLMDNDRAALKMAADSIAAAYSLLDDDARIIVDAMPETEQKTDAVSVLKTLRSETKPEDVYEKIVALPVNRINDRYRTAGLKDVAARMEADEGPKAFVFVTSLGNGIDHDSEFREILGKTPWPVAYVQLNVSEPLSDVPENVTLFYRKATDDETLPALLDALLPLVPGVESDALKWQPCVRNENGEVIFPRGYEEYLLLNIGRKPEAREDSAYNGNRVQLFALKQDELTSFAPLIPEKENEVLLASGNHPFAMNCTSAPKENVGKAETQKISCAITPNDAQMNWTVELLLTDENGMTETFAMSGEKSRFEATIQPKTSGAYSVQIQAVSGDGGITLVLDAGITTVVNRPPEAKKQPREPLYLYVGSPVDLAYEPVDLAQFFQDDAPDSLVYTLEKPVPGITADGAELRFNGPALIGIPEGEIVIIASDEGTETASIGLPVKTVDVQGMFRSGNMELKWLRDDLRKGDKAEFSITYTFPKELADYCGILSGQELIESVMSVKAELAFDTEKKAVQVGDAVFDAKNRALTWHGETDALYASGEYKLTAEMSWQNASGDMQPPMQAKVTRSIENHAPELLKKPADFRIILPGYFETDIQPHETETYDLAAHVKGETNETLTFRLMTPGYLLTQTPEGWLITDDADAQAGQSFTWRVDQAAPVISIMLKTECDAAEIAFGVVDPEGAVMEKLLTFSGGVTTADYEKRIQMRRIAIIACAVVAAGVIALIVVLCATKPSFKKKYLTVKIEGADVRTLPLSLWKRKRITLWEVVLYLGLPLANLSAPDQLSKVYIAPARRKRYKVMIPNRDECSYDGSGDLTICRALGVPVIICLSDQAQKTIRVMVCVDTK